MELDGVITFFASHHAMRAERVLKGAQMPVRLVPGPRELSPSCGVALRFPYALAEEARRSLAVARVEVEMVVRHPERAEAPAGWRSLFGLGRGAKR
ncbi:MAG: DUF3343 domain-containing protein [Bacillota bacterium]